MTTEQEPTKQDETAAMTGVMEQGALSPNGFDEFLQTGRTGRRNALPDVLSKEQAAVGTGELPEHMDKLTCTDEAAAQGSNPSVEGSQGSAGNEAPSEEGGS